jgi:hypothetical protein
VAIAGTAKYRFVDTERHICQSFDHESWTMEQSDRLRQYLICFSLDNYIPTKTNMDLVSPIEYIWKVNPDDDHDWIDREALEVQTAVLAEVIDSWS